MIRVLTGFLLVLASQVQGAPLYTAKQLGSGYLECPPELRVSARGKKIYCDLSAAVYARESGSVYYAADWWGAAKRSKLFSMLWRNGEPLLDTRRYHDDSQAFIGIEKIEAMTKTEGGQFLVASGSFTHTVDTGYADWMKISSLVYWQDGKVSEARRPDLLVSGSVLPAESVEDAEYSNYLRNGMLAAIHTVYPGTAFFKVEGLSALPGGRMAFGVRETGVHYSLSKYRNIILTTGYRIESGRLIIGTDFKLLHDLPINRKYALADEVGISSIEYDFNKHLLYMTTSYERGGGDEDLGAYIWVMPKSANSNQLLSPRLVRNKRSQPYHFAHKAEAMAIDPQGRIILIADDDKVLGRQPSSISNTETQFSRNRWQAAYTVLRVVPGSPGTALPH